MGDPTLIIAACITAIPACISAILAAKALRSSKENATKIQEVHDGVNGQTEKLIIVEKALSHGEGVKAGISQEKKLTAADAKSHAEGVQEQMDREK